MLTAALAEIIRNHVNAEIEDLYPAIVRELRCEGECKVVFCGHYLEFQMEYITCDVYIDGDFTCSLSHHSEIRDFLEEMEENA